jgi:hypothetical protein
MELELGIIYCMGGQTTYAQDDGSGDLVAVTTGEDC